MGPRYSTQKQDERILNLILKGIPPKVVFKKLNLVSIHVVYGAIRRMKKKKDGIIGFFSSFTNGKI